MRYSLGTNWDLKLIDYVFQINTKNKNCIQELFGSLSFSIFGAAKNVPPNLAKSKKFIENYIKIGKSRGIEFNYLVNASVFPNLKEKEMEREAYEYFLWIKQQEPNIVTIGNEKTLEFCQTHFPELKINLSIVLGLRRIEEVNELRHRYPSISRITLHQVMNRDRENLIAHIENAKHKKNGIKPIEVELLANEICIYDCPRLKEHYEVLSLGSQGGTRADDRKFHEWCTLERSLDPINFLNACWIRPEDVNLYEAIGVDIIKIAGREEQTEYLKTCAEAYSKEKYVGNIMDLFYKDWWLDENPPYVENANLEGFLEYLWKNHLTKIDEMSEKFNIEYIYEEN